MQTIKEKIIDVLFSTFYIILFPLQMLPSLTVIIVGSITPIFWILSAIGLVAMIVQNAKFPCFGIRLWSLGCVSGTIAALWYIRILALQAGIG